VPKNSTNIRKSVPKEVDMNQLLCFFNGMQRKRLVLLSKQESVSSSQTPFSLRVKAPAILSPTHSLWFTLRVLKRIWVTQ